MTRQAYVDHEKKRLLYWSPKSGCTSLVQWYVRGRLQQKPKEIRAKYADARAFLRENGYRLDFRKARQLIDNQGYQSIVLARHPATRVLSAFLNKFVVYQGRKIGSWDDLEPMVRKELIQWGFAGEGGQGYNGITWREFLDQISTRVNEAADREPQMDGHWNTQVPNAYARTGFTYDKILYLEDFENSIAWLNGHFDVDYKTPRTNRTNYGESELSIDATSVSSIDLGDRLDCLKKENFLTEDILKQIADIYAVDYAAFGYDPMDIRKLPSRAAVQSPEMAATPPKSAEGAAVPVMKAAPPKPSAKELEDAEPYEIINNGAAKTVVAFGGLALELGMPVFEFRKALSDLECNFVFFRDVFRSWYHADIKDFGKDFEAKGNNLKSILGPLADTKLYTVGSSAGGFAALMFSAFLKPKGTLLFGPQVFIDQKTRVMLGDKRWPRLVKAIEGDRYKSVSEVSDQISNPVHIVVGGNDELDVRHALYAKAHIDASVFILSGGKHNPARELRNAGILGELLGDFLNDKGIAPRGQLKIARRIARLQELK